MFCMKCGAKLRDGAKFCEKCGYSVTVFSDVGTAAQAEPEKTVHFRPTTASEDIRASKQKAQEHVRRAVEQVEQVVEENPVRSEYELDEKVRGSWITAGIAILLAVIAMDDGISGLASCINFMLAALFTMPVRPLDRIRKRMLSSDTVRKWIAAGIYLAGIFKLP